MKKSWLALLISALVLGATIVWYLNSKNPVNFAGISQFGIIIVLIGFGVYIGVSRLKSERRGEPAEDELSKKILQKASSMAYYISLYMWLALSYFSDKSEYETHTLIGAGILGMAVLFLACWGFIRLRGMRDA